MPHTLGTQSQPGGRSDADEYHLSLSYVCEAGERAHFELINGRTGEPSYADCQMDRGKVVQIDSRQGDVIPITI